MHQVMFTSQLFSFNIYWLCIFCQSLASSDKDICPVLSSICDAFIITLLQYLAILLTKVLLAYYVSHQDSSGLKIYEDFVFNFKKKCWIKLDLNPEPFTYLQHKDSTVQPTQLVQVIIIIIIINVDQQSPQGETH